MMRDVSVLRLLAEKAFAQASPRSGKVVELGGTRAGRNGRFFRARGCEYLSVGYEGDVRADLRDGRIPLEDGAWDAVVISMVLMYLAEPEVAALLGEARRILKPEGMLLIAEPFLDGEAPHRGLPDQLRFTAPRMQHLVSAAGFSRVETRRLGGLVSLGFAVLRGFFPGGPVAPLRGLLVRFGCLLETLVSGIGYFRRRNDRVYVGHFTTAIKP